ncbi:hypothetical protein M8C21_030574 [Ambrosia artemisiifolia]|uniref:Threonyl/alanyl tRNA synthetase SAD domain-containing protein n=1 Tax=Ambrosia artemisiifolia TaxID=4212 RepID=A0AAD5GNN1_AMBAR|nr:hypothetical protein M8C21_030574 [Ambrosia artemisiifolia]
MDHHQQLAPTTLLYHDNMFNLQSTATLLSSFHGDDGRHVFILDSTIFHPQGGGQPSDTGFITDVSSSQFKFLVQDVRSRNGVVYHYGVFEKSVEDLVTGVQVLLSVDESKRKLHSRLHRHSLGRAEWHDPRGRFPGPDEGSLLLVFLSQPCLVVSLHSAGHLLDVCLPKVGLSHLKPGKAYHFPDGPWVEYEGKVPQAELQSKMQELELEANNLISRGMTVSVAVYPYEEASMLCGGDLPDYIPKGSTPRIVKLGDFPGCPCGGTHVSNISDLVNVKVTQMRTKKGVTKVYYTIES